MARAFANRNAAYDGVFFVAVRTTGIFCRPSCPSRPLPGNVEFLPTIRECLLSGYRPCKRCRPTEVDGTPPPWVADLMRRVGETPEGKWTAEELRAAGISPERARRWFLQYHGMSFAAWCRAHRLAGAFQRIRSGSGLDESAFEAGFESTSGFREAFVRQFGSAPGQARSETTAVVVDWIESPLGPLIAGVRDKGVCLLTFADRPAVDRQLAALREFFRSALVPGGHAHLDRLRQELAEYFAGARQEFSLSVDPQGTPFQIEVWNELRRIPYGETLSYEELAARVRRPQGHRAVAQANGINRIGILIPCHRVIGKDGELTGYGGGLWRKRLLLELERTGRIPGQS